MNDLAFEWTRLAHSILLTFGYSRLKSLDKNSFLATLLIRATNHGFAKNPDRGR